MNTGNCSDRNVGLDGDCDTLAKVDTQAVLWALKEMLDRLSRHDQGEAVEVESWEGGGYLYLEAPLSHSVHVDIDVNIHEGRAFVTVAR